MVSHSRFFSKLSPPDRSRVTSVQLTRTSVAGKDMQRLGTGFGGKDKKGHVRLGSSDQEERKMSFVKKSQRRINIYIKSNAGEHCWESTRHSRKQGERDRGRYWMIWSSSLSGIGPWSFMLAIQCAATPEGHAPHQPSCQVPFLFSKAGEESENHLQTKLLNINTLFTSNIRKGLCLITE